MRVFRVCFFAFAVISVPVGSSGACPAKLSPRLCPIYEAAPESAFIQVRIILDAKAESGFVWDKKPPPGSMPPRPLRVLSESLITKYDLRQPAHPESAYVRPYRADDLSPSIDQVLYHNAGVTRSNLGKMASESFVASVETSCNRHIRPALCTEIDYKPDSDTMWVGISFGGKLESDSIARKAFLSEYAVRESSWTTEQCWGRGFMASPVSILALAGNPDILQISSPSLICTAAVQRPPSSRTSARGSRILPTFRSHRRLDGRVLPDLRHRGP